MKRVFIAEKPHCEKCDKPINDLYGYKTTTGFVHSACK
jgi:hypothetical protein